MGRSPSLRSVAAAVGVLLLLGCAPEQDPLVVDLPPRDPAAAKLRRVEIGSAGIEALTYRRHPSIGASDRALFGSWGGASTRTFIQFNRDAFQIVGEDTLTNAEIFDAECSFNCVTGQGAEGDLTVATTPVLGGTENAWSQDTLSWPGPPLAQAGQVESRISTCRPPDNFPERTIALSDSVVAAWIQDPATNNGFAITAEGDSAILQLASTENGFVATDSLGVPTGVRGPRLRFTAVKPGNDVVTVTIPAEEVIADTYVIADNAVVPSADDTTRLTVGRGVSLRTIVRLELPELPEGVNIHRAALVLTLLDHPRFDDVLDLEVFGLSSDWPQGTPVDSSIVVDGIVWSRASAEPDDDVVEIPVTGLTQAWYDGFLENRGFLIRARDEDAGVTAVAFASPSHPDPSLRPRLEVYYTTPYGGRP